MRCPERVIRQLLAEAGHAPAGRAMARQRDRARRRPPRRRNRLARNLHRLCPRRALRLARRADARPAEDLCGRAAVAQRMVARRRWTDGRQSARSLAPGAKISFRFHARDLHLVLGSASGKPVRFRVTLDGQAPGADAGVDVAADGDGRGQRSSGSISWSARKAQCATAPSRSNSSTPASRPSRSPSAEGAWLQSVQYILSSNRYSKVFSGTNRSKTAKSWPIRFAGPSGFPEAARRRRAARP